MWLIQLELIPHPRIERYVTLHELGNNVTHVYCECKRWKTIEEAVLVVETEHGLTIYCRSCHPGAIQRSIRNGTKTATRS